MKDDRETKMDVENGAAQDTDTQRAEDVRDASDTTVDDARTDTAPAGDLTLELENEQRRAKEFEDRFLRTAAEFENYKKRMSRQHEEIVRTANDRILLELLEIVDNFERALQHNSNDSGEPSSLRTGTEMIYNQMQNLLKRHDVTPIEAVGKPFDANLHEAMMEVASNEYDAGIVAMEITRGYMHHERVLRHSKVGVSKGPADDSNDE